MRHTYVILARVIRRNRFGRTVWWRNRWIRVACAGGICLSLASASGCGESKQKRTAQQLENLSVLSRTTPLGQRLIKESEITSASDSSGVRTFLQLWSLLQYQSWDQAERLFEPGLRDAVGPALLAESLQNGLAIWQGTKPKIVSTRVSGGTALITFLARDEQGNVIPTSISFGGTPGKWRVSYLPLLNGLIQRTVQLGAQAQIEPLASKPSAEAVRQGDNAAVIQSHYLERKLRGTAAH